MSRIYQLVISAALGVLGVLGIILLCTTSEDLERPAGYKYGIVIDAGSSRTTLFVYKWPAGKENNTGIVSEHSYCKVAGAGISSYAADPPAAGNSLKTCLDRTVETIPTERHAETPLYLGATAGMRLLNLTDPEATEGVLAALTTTLKSYKFNFQGAKILSGSEEGVFGWVTANYLLENLVKYSWIGRWIKPVRSTVGAMDFGGASTQISFVPREKIEDPESEVFLRLYSQDYKVYTHSYLCYGRDQVMKKVLSQMMIAQGYSSNITNPCMPKGYNVTYSQAFIYDSPCTASKRPMNYSSQKSITFSGVSNPAECSRFVDTIFEFAHCAHSTCAFNGVYQPGVTGDFLAFAAFYYTMNFLKTRLNISITSPSELSDAANTICGLDFKKLMETAPNEPIIRLVDYCTTSYYIHTLITRGYKFNEQSFKNIAFQKKAGDTTIGWALGYMLNLTNMIPAEAPDLHKAQVVGAWGVLIAIFILVIVTGLLVFVLSSRSVKTDSVL